MPIAPVNDPIPHFAIFIKYFTVYMLVCGEKDFIIQATQPVSIVLQVDLWGRHRVK